MNNLNLPICPKCNETKFVTRETCTKLLPFLITHKCNDCNITWNGRVYIDGFDEETPFVNHIRRRETI